jgi:hypothetical protein
MKKYIFFTTFFCGIYFLGVSQKIDAGYLLRGYTLSNYLTYFDSIHNLKKGMLTDLDSSSYCLVTFRIGEDSKIYDFEFIEATGMPLNPKIKEYILSIFNETEGRWEKNPQNNNYSKEIYEVKILKKDRDSPSELMRLDKFLAFKLYELDAIKKSKGLTQEYEPKLSLSF